MARRGGQNSAQEVSAADENELSDPRVSKRQHFGWKSGFASRYFVDVLLRLLAHSRQCENATHVKWNWPAIFIHGSG